jgi:hypothetical protein
MVSCLNWAIDAQCRGKDDFYENFDTAAYCTIWILSTV